ncbi:MAG: alanine racemase [Clostridia bacterium]|nr:alanine racemase [Clostridia bacterium]
MIQFSKYIVSKSAFESNLQKIRSILGAKTELCACVKANAYGVGVRGVVGAIGASVDAFAVANIFEAVEVRRFSSKPIYILGAVAPEDLFVCSEQGFIVCVSSLSFLRSKGDFKVKICLAVNTGMNRYGFDSLSAFKKAAILTQRSKRWVLNGVMSHFAFNGANLDEMRAQYDKFVRFISSVKLPGGIKLHIGASGALPLSGFHCDMERVGFALYCCQDIGRELRTDDVVSVVSRVVQIRSCKAGERVGYDGAYELKKDADIGVIPLGYADGIDRRLTGFCVLINGKFCKIIGNICMDCFMVDLSGTGAKKYDEVVIIGKQGIHKISVSDLATHAKASPYEIISRINYKRMEYVFE